ncbi:MAG: PA1571 family protein [Pseudomonadota bacterium]
MPQTAESNVYPLRPRTAPVPASGSSVGRDFHGAAIIDAHGREIPITEEMVGRALYELDQAWRSNHQPGTQRTV